MVRRIRNSYASGVKNSGGSWAAVASPSVPDGRRRVTVGRDFSSVAVDRLQLPAGMQILLSEIHPPPPR